MTQRVISVVLFSIIFFTQTVYSQETSISSNVEISDNYKDLVTKKYFYQVPNKGKKSIFKEAVTSHIVQNKGIQDFYAVPTIETKWLDNILLSEKKWHEQLQKLEQNYRKAFQRRTGLKSGQDDMAVRIENYTKSITRIEEEIEEIRRQIVQINVDQQVYINSLRSTPITTLVAIRTLYTNDIMKIKEKPDVLNKSIFKSLEVPVLGHITTNYGKIANIPFKTGHVTVTYIYPENITLFDSKANEYVYLFLRVEGYPFSNGSSNTGIENPREIEIQIFSDIDQIESYLNTKLVGDQRLQNWLKKEYNYQKIGNTHNLDAITARLDEFEMFRNGLKNNIDELNTKAKEIGAKRDLIISGGTVKSIEEEYERAKNFYRNFFSKRQVLTHEKYILENDVIYSLSQVAGESKRNNSKKQNIGRNVLGSIKINGRPLKNIFTDILLTANKKRELSLQNYRERIYRPNEEYTQLIQGELEWEIESEEFRILKLTRGNVGSNSHFVLHLAKRSNLKSIPGFPAEKSGTCKATLLFKRGKNIMRNSSKPRLNRLVKCLRKFPQQKIQITGHTDPLKPNYGEGSKFSNVILGLKRAETMVKALVQLKFNAGRFIVISRGAQMPVSIGKRNKDLEKNRRVEIVSKPSF